MGGSGSHEGNIFIGGLPVCDDLHDHNNALVVCRFQGVQNIGTTAILQLYDMKNVCRMLGYSYAQHTTGSHFGSVPSTFSMDDVECTGNEASFLDCPHTTVHNCGSHEGAGVICSNSGEENQDMFSDAETCISKGGHP